jgi:peptide/nickel transport system permease protein
MMPGRMELLAKNTRFQVALGVVIFMIIAGVIGPFFTYDPYIFPGKRNEPPSWDHKMGTDIFGRDLWAQLFYGLRNSLVVGFTAGLIALVVAFMVGGIGAYKGGLFDEGLNLFSNVFLTLPTIPLLLVVSVALGTRSLLFVAFVISIILWAGAARALRSQVLSLKQRGFVDLARVSGRGGFRILFGEIFPNMLAYVFIQFVGMVGAAIVAEAGISVLGLGPSSAVTLGNVLHWAIGNQAVGEGIWWWFIPPGLVIVLFTGSMVMIGSVMDDVLNPKLAGVLG